MVVSWPWTAQTTVAPRPTPHRRLPAGPETARRAWAWDRGPRAGGSAWWGRGAREGEVAARGEEEAARETAEAMPVATGTGGEFRKLGEERARLL